MTFAEYVDLMRLRSVPSQGTTIAAETSTPFAALLNQRFMRNLQTFTVSNELKRAVKEIREAQEWMILTEPSCGDSSQMIPLIARIAECNPLIKLDFVLRDQHPEIMDSYLT